MKKKLILLACFLLIAFLICRNAENKSDKETDFSIFQSYINTGGDFKRTLLRVIVYKKDFEEEELFEEIKIFHARMNGVSDELTIVLYGSKEDLLNGVKMGERTFLNE